MKSLFLFFLSLCFIVFSKAQDMRISQYNSVPILISPASTGDFEGLIRTSTSIVKNSTPDLNNLFYNLSAAYKLGEKQKSAIGFSYSNSGAKGFSMTNNYYGLSASHLMYLDANKTNSLSVGFLASYVVGSYKVSNASYNPWLDTRSFFYYNPVDSGDLDLFSNKYMNFAAGINYSYCINNIKFESKLGAYNIFNPKFNIIKMNKLKKRVRLSFENAFTYKINQLNSIRISQFSWQEGVYLRKAPTQISDSLQISETIYGVDWTRQYKIPLSVGLFTRSMKSAYISLGCDFHKRFFTKISYEIPFNKKYYNVSQFGVSMIYIKK